MKDLPVPPELWARLRELLEKPHPFYGRVEINYANGQIVSFQVIEVVKVVDTERQRRCAA